MSLPNGCVYEGDFTGGAREGRGTYYWASGFAEIGRFKNGKGVGEGVRWSPDRAYALGLKDGRVVGTFPSPDEPTVAISAEQATQIAEQIGLPMPPLANAPPPALPPELPTGRQ